MKYGARSLRMSASAESGSRAPAGRGDERGAHGIEVGFGGRVEAHRQVEGRLALLDATHRHAGEGRLDRFRHLPDRQAMASQRIALEAHGQEGNVGLLLVGDIDRALDVLHNALDGCGQPPQFGQIGAENLDRDIGATARQHVVDAVGDRLADDDLRAGHAGQVGAQCGEEILLAALAHLQGDLHFGAETSMACGSPSARPVRRAVATTSGMRQQDLLDHLPEPVGFFQRGARQRGGADRQRALVEVRQEGAAGERQGNQGDEQRGNAHRGHIFQRVTVASSTRR